MLCSLRATGLVLGLLTSATSVAASGKVVLIGDEWTLTDNAFSTNQTEAEDLVDALDTFLGSERYGVYSNNFAYGPSLDAYITGRDDDIEDVSSIGAIGAYDTIFLAGLLGRADDATNLSIWENYIDAGGNVVITLGTGEFFNPAGEAAAWNPLTTQYGLTAGTVWFESGLRNEPVSGGSFSGTVSAMRWGNGQTVSATGDAEIAINGAFAGTAFADAGIVGLSETAAPIPLPAGIWLLGTGLAGIVALRRRSGS